MISPSGGGGGGGGGFLLVLLLLIFLHQPLHGHCMSQDRESQERKPIRPDHKSAKTNAYHLFNAIHSAGRQWASSINHNGFSFLPVTLPKGSILYHGSILNSTPTGFEWLAFESEHAEFFSHPLPWLPPHEGPGSTSNPSTEEGPDSAKAREEVHGQHILGKHATEEGAQVQGYLHTYQASRDLNLLYIDGMSAAKSSFGTLDSTDTVLRQWYDSGWKAVNGDLTRAREVCAVVKSWGLDGIMRMEIGFEVIYCDFQDSGLNQLSALRSYAVEDMAGHLEEAVYQWVRAAGERFDGLGRGRVKIDFSSMVSGFMFPINISSTDPAKPDLIRYGAVDKQHTLDIKDYLAGVMAAPRRFHTDWQAVVDMITSRYSNRLARMASENTSHRSFVNELEGATLCFADAPLGPDEADSLDHRRDSQSLGNDQDTTTDAVQRCITHPLLQAQTRRSEWSLEDELINTALSTVMTEICTTLFTIRSHLLKATSASSHRIHAPSMASPVFGAAMDVSRDAVRTLMEKWSWTGWRRTRACADDDIEFIAMFPFGSTRDHYEPGCRKADYFESSTFREGDYWNFAKNYETQRPSSSAGFESEEL